MRHFRKLCQEFYNIKSDILLYLKSMVKLDLSFSNVKVKIRLYGLQTLFEVSGSNVGYR